MEENISRLKHYVECLGVDDAALSEITKTLAGFSIDTALEEIAKIKQDFVTYLPDHPIEDIDRLINYDPAHMQIIFRRMLHTKNEGRALFGTEKPRAAHHYALQPLYEAVYSLSLQPNNRYYKKLKDELIKLQGELYKNALLSHDEACVQEAHTLAVSAKAMVDGILTADNKTMGMGYVESFEAKARALPSFQKSSKWESVGKAVACVILGAVGAVIGAVVGGLVEAAITTLITAPVGGIGGPFGALSGVLHGSITGWGLGILGASALGLACGAGSGAIFINTKDRIDHVSAAASSLARHCRRQ